MLTARFAHAKMREEEDENFYAAAASEWAKALFPLILAMGVEQEKEWDEHRPPIDLVELAFQKWNSLSDEEKAAKIEKSRMCQQIFLDSIDL